MQIRFTTQAAFPRKSAKEDQMSEQAASASDPAAPHESRSPALKLVILAAVVAGLVLGGRQAAGYLVDVAEWIKGFGAWSAAVFAAVYALAAVAFVPGSLLTLAGGIIFGVVQGSIVVYIGATVGATLAFLIARHFARRWVAAKVEGDPKFAAIDRAIGDNGLKIAFLLRLSPAFPFNLLNYALGLTKVSLRDYVIAHLGMIPGTVLYVYGGAAIGDLAALAGGQAPGRSMASNILFGVGLVATLVVTVLITRIARRALSEAAGDEVA